jgi:ribosomal protein S18 acetylase RimI-like enzyme
MSPKKYTLKYHTPKGQGAYGLHTVTAHDHLGNVVGELSAEDLGDGTFQANMVEVHPEHRRKGIAGAMYDHMQSKTKLNAVPDLEAQTSDARKFWANRKGLKKGAEGDWKKEGIKIRHKPNRDGSITVSAYHPEEKDFFGKKGAQIGVVHVDSRGRVENAQVNEKHRRKGVASAMYSRAEKAMSEFDRPIKRGHTQTEAAQALWNNKNRPFGKSEQIYNSLQKASASKKLLGMLGLAAATTIPMSMPSDQKPVKEFVSPQVQQYASSPDQKRDVDLNAIAQVESRGGKDTKHKVITTGLNAGMSAYGKYGLTPKLTQEIIHKNPEFNNIKNIAKLPPNEIGKKIMSTPKLEDRIAQAHYDHLSQKFNGDFEKIGFAWLNGVAGTHRAIASGRDISNHWHVKKLKNAKSKILGKK